MATASVRQARIQLAQQLPPILQRFFTRYPPGLANAAPALPLNASTPSQEPSEAPSAAATPSNATIDSEPRPPTPFQVWKHPITGLWQEPVYSLRRQAQLCKIAREHGVEELLPYSVKKSGVRALRRFEEGLRVRGTGVGQKVKGHLDERLLRKKVALRRRAMVRMPRLIMKWREVSLYILGMRRHANGQAGGSWTALEGQGLEEEEVAAVVSGAARCSVWHLWGWTTASSRNNQAMLQQTGT